MDQIGLESMSATCVTALLCYASWSLRLSLKRILSIGNVLQTLASSRVRAVALEKGEMAPPFSVPLLSDSEVLVSSRSLRDRPFMLFFVSYPAHMTSPYRQLGQSLHGAWHKSQGSIYVVCHGTNGECREMLGPHLDTSHADKRIPVLVDTSGKLLKDFNVGRTPSAVQVGASGRVEMMGLQRDDVSVTS